MLLLQQITIVIKIERHIYVLKDNTFIQSRPVPPQGMPRTTGRENVQKCIIHRIDMYYYKVLQLKYK